MGRKCCVPGCKSNYDGQPYTPCFKFPKDSEQRAKWLNCIHRKDFIPSNTAVVCVNHFSDNFVIREDRMRRADGSELVVPRKHLALQKDAYPTIFEGQPSYFSMPPMKPRRNPEERRNDAKLAEEKEFRDWCEKDTVKSFGELLSGFKKRLNSGWLVLCESENVILGKMCFVDSPKIIVSVKFSSDLSISVWHNGVPLPKSGLLWVLGPGLLCDRWTKFESLLSHLFTFELRDSTSKIDMALEVLELCLGDFPDKDSKLNFIIEQLQLINVKKPKYSSNFLVWCCSLYFSYPASYSFLKDSGVMSLPSVSYLRQLGSNMAVGKTGPKNIHVSYLVEKFKTLEESESLVSLLLDEIYVKPGLSYVGGKVVGQTNGNVAEAVTLQCFMITSVFSKNKDVVALYPVNHLTASHLQKLVMEVLQMLTEIGYQVLCLISDNNRVNRNMFRLLCGGSLATSFKNPFNEMNSVFIVFDTVHLLKSVRNNWLNQWKTNQTFYIPSFHDFTTPTKPTVQHLKLIYNKEIGMSVKTAPSLSQKVLYPSPLERQNVKYAVKLFDEKNIASLDHFSAELGKDLLDTKGFMEVILKWWRVVNVKHPMKGIHLREEFSCPIRSVDDASLEFLKKFCIWLDEWNVSPKDSGTAVLGKLSQDTYTALKHTTQCLIDLSCHLLMNFQSMYVLLGKFQTDQLESRFGKYRGMNGGNYNVGVKQVLETENKIRLIGLLKIKSSKFGDIPIKTFVEQCSDDLVEEDLPMSFMDILLEEYLPPEVEAESIVFVSGYVSRQVKKSVRCQECASHFCVDREMIVDVVPSTELCDYSYLEFVDRGGLMWPSRFAIDICNITYFIFQILIDDRYETMYLSCANQKGVLVNLAAQKIEIMYSDLSSVCGCGNDMKKLIRKCIGVMSNILLNNYCKNKTDAIKRQRSTKRKLSTLDVQN